MKVTQEKPKVIGYQQIGFMGGRFYVPNYILKHELNVIATEDLDNSGVKSKFRPVYEVKNES